MVKEFSDWASFGSLRYRHQWCKVRYSVVIDIESQLKQEIHYPMLFPVTIILQMCAVDFECPLNPHLTEWNFPILAAN